MLIALPSCALALVVGFHVKPEVLSRGMYFWVVGAIQGAVRISPVIYDMYSGLVCPIVIVCEGMGCTDLKAFWKEHFIARKHLPACIVLLGLYMCA